MDDMDQLPALEEPSGPIGPVEERPLPGAADLQMGELDLRLDESIAYYILVMERVGGVDKFLSEEPATT